MPFPLSFTSPIVGQPHASEDPKVSTALTQVLEWGNTQALTMPTSAAEYNTLGPQLFAWGAAGVTFGAGHSYSNTITVAHGLPNTPGLVVPVTTFNSPGTGALCALTWQAADATNIYLYATCNPAPVSSFTLALSWFAICNANV